MQKEQHYEAEEYEGMGQPSVDAFVKNSFLQEDIGEKRLEDPKEPDTENDLEKTGKCHLQAGTERYFFSGRGDCMAEPDG